MTSTLFDGALGKLAYAVATAAVLGGGNTLLGTWKTNAEQEIRINRLEQLAGELDETNDSLTELERQLSILIERMRKSDGE
jgi:CO/xanthine dehydrogenase FAD-binding subunit